ncbi:L,D-transpeptidase [Streptacidiphilus carbonis]|jgi:lipoprotein-anchoring transpeptidase ErfK/SrfK|uniref:L,D-transpeptidase n=1 Tax=Streptacidiphilus carbonis TaxID=105422 RepID=UPI000A00A855|nr:Ig-like domain-containing protein [Streptacidiphilus carbonis]
MRARARVLAKTAAVVAMVTGPLMLCGCGGGSGGLGQETSVDAAGLVSLSPSGRTVDPAAPVVVTAAHGQLTDVVVADAAGRRLAGAIAADDRSWRSSAPLSAGELYTVRISADNGAGGRGTTVQQFATRPAPKTLTVKLTPGDKGVYGVGEPITATLSTPVHDQAARKAVERGLTVDSTPSVQGGWYWVDDSTLHFRPRTFWPAHAVVSAAFAMPGLPVGSGLYAGAPSRTSFSTGDKVLAITDAGTDQLTFYRNDKVVNTLPITTGKPGFATRSGYKVVLERSPVVLMDSTTIGIPAGSSESYHLVVRWDTRVTWSGEYLHAAPWSVGSQGVSNVSHGCTGMSTDDAHWFYDNVRPGDVVQVVNSGGHQMEDFSNGFGDWNLSWSDWLKGSALGEPVDTGSATARTAGPTGYLRPQA